MLTADWTPLQGALLPLRPGDTADRLGRSVPSGVEDYVTSDLFLSPVKLEIRITLLGWHRCVFSIKLVFRISRAVDEILLICTMAEQNMATSESVFRAVFLLL